MPQTIATPTTNDGTKPRAFPSISNQFLLEPKKSHFSSRAPSRHLSCQSTEFEIESSRGGVRFGHDDLSIIGVTELRQSSLRNGIQGMRRLVLSLAKDG